VTTLGRYKQGKQTQPIEFQDFQKVIQEGKFKKQSHRSLLAFLYLTGVRVSEALGCTKEDFVFHEDGTVDIKIPSLKHGTREYLKLHMTLPFMSLIWEQVKRAKAGRKVWSFSDRTAERAVKLAMGDKYYPHFFRLNRAVHFLDDATTSTPDMLSWFGWRNIRSINPYLGFSTRHLNAQLARLKNTV
jgi:integrase